MHRHQHASAVSRTGENTWCYVISEEPETPEEWSEFRDHVYRNGRKTIRRAFSGPSPACNEKRQRAA